MYCIEGAHDQISEMFGLVKHIMVLMKHFVVSN